MTNPRLLADAVLRPVLMKGTARQGILQICRSTFSVGRQQPATTRAAIYHRSSSCVAAGSVILCREAAPYQSLSSSTVLSGKISALSSNDHSKQSRTILSWVALLSGCYGVAGVTAHQHTTLCDAGEADEASTSAEQTKKEDAGSGSAPTEISEPHNTVVSDSLCQSDGYEEYVDRLVDEIMADPHINISAIPDAIERHIYKSTIQLTLTLFYSVVDGLNGTPIWQHELVVRHLNSSSDSSSDLDDADGAAISKTKMVNDHVLEEIADRLLANKAVNSPVIPDVIERQVYVNCLKVVFRVVERLTRTFKLSICGHDVQFKLTPSVTPTTVSGAVLAKSSLTKIDADRLRDYAIQTASINEDDSASASDMELSWWERLFLPKDFVPQLHATLYGLVLGITDEVLANGTVHFLGEEIGFDIVAPSEDAARTRPAPVAANDKSATASTGDSSSSMAAALAAFSAGLGIGVTLMAVLLSPQR